MSNFIGNTFVEYFPEFSWNYFGFRWSSNRRKNMICSSHRCQRTKQAIWSAPVMT
jgi:hypothetical protein